MPQSLFAHRDIANNMNKIISQEVKLFFFSYYLQYPHSKWWYSDTRILKISIYHSECIWETEQQTCTNHKMPPPPKKGFKTLPCKEWSSGWRVRSGPGGGGTRRTQTPMGHQVVLRVLWVWSSPTIQWQHGGPGAKAPRDPRARRRRSNGSEMWCIIHYVWWMMVVHGSSIEKHLKKNISLDMVKLSVTSIHFLFLTQSPWSLTWRQA